MTAIDLADELSIGRHALRDRLSALYGHGIIDRKKVWARGRLVAHREGDRGR